MRKARELTLDKNGKVIGEKEVNIYSGKDMPPADAKTLDEDWLHPEKK